MSKRKKATRKQKKKLTWPAWLSVGDELRRRILGRTVIGLSLVTVMVGVIVGLYRLEQVALQHDRFQEPAELHLIDAPNGIRNDLMADLEPVLGVAWGEPGLTRDIGVILEANPWVQEVRSVRKYGNGRIDIDCQYRHPVALIRYNEALYLVSRDRVRLPGRYAYDPALLVVEGVAVPPPEPGEVWAAPDLHAGLAVVEQVEPEVFAGQITGVLVDNYGGRMNNEEGHLRLITDRAGGTIIWGSAPGEEMEENTAAEKIAILRENYRRFGRIDANRQTIDVSIHPKRFMTPA